MAISATLQDERGKPVVETDAVLDFPLTRRSRVLDLLRYIDPYGDTYFNRLQMDQFITEWKEIEPTDPAHHENWQLVLQMSETCRDTPHLLSEVCWGLKSD